MNESIDRKSAVASTVKDPKKGASMGVRCVVFFAVLVFANLPAVAFAQSSSCRGIHAASFKYDGGTLDLTISLHY